MCGRYYLDSGEADIIRAFGIPPARMPALAPNPQQAIRPGHAIIVVQHDTRAHNPYASAIEWGFTPSWARDGRPLINARAESAASKPTFAAAYRTGRCLVPATAFQEWDAEQQCWVTFTPGNGLLGLAGLVNMFPGESLERSCVILTTAASADVEPTHHRMPAIIAPAQYEAWLAGEPIAIGPSPPHTLCASDGTRQEPPVRPRRTAAHLPEPVPPATRRAGPWTDSITDGRAPPRRGSKPSSHD